LKRAGRIAAHDLRGGRIDRRLRELAVQTDFRDQRPRAEEKFLDFQLGFDRGEHLAMGFLQQWPVGVPLAKQGPPRRR